MGRGDDKLRIYQAPSGIQGALLTLAPQAPSSRPSVGGCLLQSLSTFHIGCSLVFILNPHCSDPPHCSQKTCLENLDLKMAFSLGRVYVHLWPVCALWPCSSHHRSPCACCSSLAGPICHRNTLVCLYPCPLFQMGPHPSSICPFKAWPLKFQFWLKCLSQARFFSQISPQIQNTSQ